MNRDQLQPYTYYNPDGKPPLWLILVGGAAMVGVGYMLFGREQTASFGTPSPSAPPPDDDLPPPPPPDTPGPGDIAPGPGTPPPPPTPPQHPGGIKPPEPPPGPEPGAPIDFDTTGAGELDVADYPWGDDGKVYIHPSTATPSMFLRVGAGDNLDKVVREAVGSALALAGRADLAAYMSPNHGGTGEPWAKRLRAQMREALICGWWNDTLYGQTSAQKAGGEIGIGPNGHGLNWTPVHANNIGLLAAGLPAERSTTLAGNRDAAFTPQEANYQMDLWIPAPSLDALKGTPKEQLNLVFDVEWSNGLRAINPPSQVSEGLGINYALFVGGCPGWSQG